MTTIGVECHGARPLARDFLNMAGLRKSAFQIKCDREDGSWTRLSLRAPGDADQDIEILPLTLEPLVLQVVCRDAQLAHTLAFFLAMETQGRII